MRFSSIAAYIAAALLLPSIALAAAPKSFSDLVNLLVSLMNNATLVLITLGLVIYFYGISTSLFKSKEEGSEKLKMYLLWGILILFVMVSIWGILRLLENTLFGSGAANSSSGAVNSGQQNQFIPPRYTE